ncbi:MAG: hypothetical protein AAB774_00645 [Patescibacteria group bacterium]
MTAKPLDIIIGRAVAAVDDIKLSLPTALYDPDKPGDYNLQETVTSLIFAFLAAAAFIGIIYSGVMMITAGGDATKFAAGKKNLVWSIIGIIIVVLSYFIIKFIYSLSGALIGAPTP